MTDRLTKTVTISVTPVILNIEKRANPKPSTFSVYNKMHYVHRYLQLCIC